MKQLVEGMANMLRISRSDLDRIYAQAREEYPAECCGILTLAKDNGVCAVHVCENIQAQKHREDPGRYPRDARAAYLIDPKEMMRISETTEAAGGRIAGYYHSHIDCPAYFSEEDERRTWIFNDREAGEGPDAPDVAYLVLSVYGEEAAVGSGEREVKGSKCFAWDGSEYAEMPVMSVD